MKDLSEQAQVLAAAETWRSMFEQPNGWAVTQQGTSSKDVYDQLCQLGDNATAEDVALLTGMNMVTPHRCDECGRNTYSAVACGGAAICIICLYKGIGVVTGLARP